MKQLGIDKWKGEEPLWRHLEVIDRQHYDINDVIDPDKLKKEINNLIMEKGELANHLQKAQTQMQDKVLLYLEKEKMMQADMEKCRLQLKQSVKRAEELSKLQDLKGFPDRNKYDTGFSKKQYDQQGVKYSDSVSIFSTDDNQSVNEDESTTNNMLDIYIGDVDFEPTDIGIMTSNRINDPESLSHLNTFCTIDFYNHETQHSNIAVGIKTQYKFQVCFKVTVDEFFVQFLNTGQIKIEIYAAVQTEPLKIGQALIPLNQLIKMNMDKENMRD